jgi:hypothetical protein
MAAYAATVAPASTIVHKFRGVGGLAALHGTVDITNYNQTLAEITGITKFFRGAVTVIASGISDNGYHVRWDATGKSFRAYYGTNTLAGQAAAEQVANDVDVGLVHFIAMGVAP